MQIRERLEEFRSFSTSKRPKTEKKGMGEGITKKKIIKTQNKFCERNFQLRNQTTKLEIETE